MARKPKETATEEKSTEQKFVGAQSERSMSKLEAEMKAGQAAAKKYQPK